MTATSQTQTADKRGAGKQTASTEHRYHVKRADLPLSCPSPMMALWDSHPRVYLPIEATGQARCPYCGAEYILED